jgi:hypothetical protein
MSDLPQALQTSQLAELGRFGGGSNELKIHGNGVVMLHVPITLPHFFSFIFFLLLFLFCPLFFFSSYLLLLLFFLVFKLLLEKTQ